MILATPELHDLERAEGAVWFRALPKLVQSLSPKAAALRFAGGFAFDLAEGAPLRYAIGAAAGCRVSEPEFGAFERFYRSRALLPIVEVAPFADPSLHDLLSARGYRETLRLAILGCRLKASPGPDRSDVQIRQTSADEADLWLATVAGGFRDSGSQAWIDRAIASNRVAADMTYLACIDGVVAGGAALSIHGDVAVLYSGSTLVPFRGRGVQAALLRARLADARRRGARTAVVKTVVHSPSQRNVERAGFQPLYVRSRMEAPSGGQPSGGVENGPAL